VKYKFSKFAATAVTQRQIIREPNEENLAGNAKKTNINSSFNTSTVDRGTFFSPRSGLEETR